MVLESPFRNCRNWGPRNLLKVKQVGRGKVLIQMSAFWFQKIDSKLGHYGVWSGSLRLNTLTLQVGSQYLWIITTICRCVSFWPLAEFLPWKRLMQSPTKTEIVHSESDWLFIPLAVVSGSSLGTFLLVLKLKMFYADNWVTIQK